MLVVCLLVCPELIRKSRRARKLKVAHRDIFDYYNSLLVSKRNVGIFTLLDRYLGITFVVFTYSISNFSFVWSISEHIFVHITGLLRHQISTFEINGLFFVLGCSKINI